MSDDDEDRLTQAVHEFDRLMAADDDSHDTRGGVVIDDLALAALVDAAKPDVDVDDAALNGIELVQLPLPNDRQKSEQANLK